MTDDKPKSLATLVKHLDGAGENSAANVRFLWGTMSDLAKATLAEVERIDATLEADHRSQHEFDERLADLERRVKAIHKLESDKWRNAKDVFFGRWSAT